MTNPNYPIRPQPNARMTEYEKLNPAYPIALKVRGMFYPYAIFREMPYGRVINKLYRPYNPRTEKQQAQRMKYGYAVGNWRSFTDEIKNYYNRLKYPKNATGVNRYIQLYLLTP